MSDRDKIEALAERVSKVFVEMAECLHEGYELGLCADLKDDATLYDEFTELDTTLAGEIEGFKMDDSGDDDLNRLGSDNG